MCETGRVTTYDLVTHVTEDDSRAVFAVYDAVFGDQPDHADWRSRTWDPHAARTGFRLARAYVEARLVGFGYGYTGEHGQWWTDHAAHVLAPDVARAWLGGHFELVSIGVLPEVRGLGVGGQLLSRLTDGLPHERWLLMTSADESDPARRLYARHGWRVLGRGLSEDQVIMGRRR